MVRGSRFGGRRGMRLLRFARNDRGLVSEPEGGITPSVKKGYAKLSIINNKDLRRKGIC